MEDNLDNILRENGGVARAYPDNKDMPFGAVIYKDKQVLTRIEPIIFPSGDSGYVVWRGVPLGLRKENKSYFDDVEEFYKPEVSTGELKDMLLDSKENISDFVATMNMPYSVLERGIGWSGWDDPRNVQIHQVVVDYVEELNLKKGRVLDIGCGSGKLALAVQEGSPSLDVYGMDFEEENVEITGKLLGPKKSKQGDATKIGDVFGKKKFDVIIASALLEREVLYQEDVAESIVKSAYEQLNPGGHFIATGYTPLLINKKSFSNRKFKVTNTIVPENLFTFDMPKQLYVAQKRS